MMFWSNNKHFEAYIQTQRNCLMNDEKCKKKPIPQQHERNVKITLTTKQNSIKFNVNGYVQKQKKKRDSR